MTKNNKKIILPDDVLSDIITELTIGTSVVSLAIKYDLPRSTLFSILKRHGISSTHKQYHAEIREKEVLKLTHLHISEIVRQTGIDKKTVRNVLLKNNIQKAKPIRVRSPVPKESQLYDGFCQKYTLDDVRTMVSISVKYTARTTGYSPHIIMRYVRDNNIFYTTKNVVTLSSQTKELITHLYTNTSMSRPEIATQCNVETHTVTRLTKKLTRLVPKTYERDPELLKYSELARRYTSVTKLFYNIDVPSGHHLDHMVSIYDGFMNNVPAELIASIHNLEVVPIKVNLQKHKTSSQTIATLYNKLGLNV